MGLQIRSISVEMLNAYPLWRRHFCFYCLIRRNSNMFGQTANHKDSLSCIHFYPSWRPTLCQTQWMYPRDSTGKKAALVHWLFWDRVPQGLELQACATTYDSENILFWRSWSASKRKPKQNQRITSLTKDQIEYSRASISSVRKYSVQLINEDKNKLRYPLREK